MARQDAIDNGIDPALYERQINQESGFNPNAVSSAGAIGIAQIMPSTASSWHVDPWNAADSLRVAADHMHWYYQHYGYDYAKALAAYNCGPNCVGGALAGCSSFWRRCIPAETKNYIENIMS
ncbi:MAG TPA: lytic transglycosylase domain-containing protein [Ktedonobacteraceae bacterium]|jgi:soluble lytic murein transglycosylase-like protein|nr:lytic transglycosylase domain-containing protein [Ktedonobacteraceae bacterium]